MTNARVPLLLDGVHVLVTGAGGFVGSHLRHTLAAQGARVYGMGQEADPPGGPLEGWHVAELRDPEAVGAGVAQSRPGAVVHLAGQASAGRSFQSPRETFETNVAGTWHLLDAVRLHAPAARVLVIGSSEAYGPQAEGTRVAETAEFRPVSPYAFSKATADAIAASFAEQHGMDVVRTRSFSHTGAGQTTRFALPSWAEQIAAFENSGAPGTLRVGNLDVTRDILDVRDVVECYARLLERGVRGEAYNVCRGEALRLREVVNLMVTLALVPVEVTTDPARVRSADVAYLVGDPTKTLRATGWTPSRSIRGMLEDLLTHWRNAAPAPPGPPRD